MAKRPNMIVVGGHRYIATPALINTKHPNRAPRNVTLMLDDGSIELAGGEEFAILYVRRDMMNPPAPEGPSRSDLSWPPSAG